MELGRKDDFSLTSTGLVGIHQGRLDYLFPVYQEDTSTINFYVAMLYSGSRGCQSMKDTSGCVEPYQIKWLETELFKLDEKMPVYLFLHIPVPEYNQAWDVPSTNGSKYESTGSSDVNTGLVELLVKSENVITISCGHDQNNDFDSIYKGIRMLYGRKTGFGSYGPDHYNRGARVFEIKKNAWEFNTRIRSAGGMVEHQTYRTFEIFKFLHYSIAIVGIAIVLLVFFYCRRRFTFIRRYLF
ncbi:Metallo-dependent phosphatase-like protein [Globomyces pollinis-pini]|nr:Metallo-dependent phosphatase-like protein [Globomyces pollinis-pini]